MLTRSNIKTIVVLLVSFFFIACNNDKKKFKIQKVTLEDIKQEESKPEPPPPPPPKPDPQKVDITNAVQQCYVNEGLRFETTVTIYIGTDKTVGIVAAEDLQSGELKKTGFEGIKRGDTIFAKFTGEPPPSGDHSEWLVTPWIMKKKNGMEVLVIAFNALDFKTNKWKTTNFDFDKIDCK